MKPLEYLAKNEAQSVEQLKELLRIPSVSAKSEHKPDMTACAKFLKNYLDSIGLPTSIIPTKGHPIVYGEYGSDPEKPTILIYGHYDVQPPDPLHLWKSSPFDPIEENGYLIARGVEDDKGQIFAHIKGLEAYRKTDTPLPVNIKLLIEGEEEVGADNVTKYVENNKNNLSCDIAVVSDGAQYGIDQPAINYGLRGTTGVEVVITGPYKDLHSGSFGGSIANPINVLCKLIGTLHDDNGHIAVDGFYDDVILPSKEEIEQLKKLPFSKEVFLNRTGSVKLWGEKGFSTLERTWMRPTLDCNGITGGYQGEGGKTIIPSWASTKITSRLVPHMDPLDIVDKIEKFLTKNCPDYVTLEITKHAGCNPIVFSINSDWHKAASSAIKKVFHRDPYFTREGGSIPIVETFKTELGIDTLLIGFGQHDGNAHSPNERLLLKDFHRGSQVSVALLEELSKVTREQRIPLETA